MVDALFDSWDGEGAGKLEIAELDRQLNEGRQGKDKHKGGSKMLRGELFTDGNKSVQEQLRDALVANSMRVIDLFLEWDEDGDGEVDRKEFHKAMPMLGLHAAKEHIDALFDLFDSDGGGSIGFRELNRLLRRDVKAEKKKEVKVLERIEVADVKTLRSQCAMLMLPVANLCVKALEDPFAPVDLDKEEREKQGHCERKGGFCALGDKEGAAALQPTKAEARTEPPRRH